ncbi:MAG: hypothetical protein M3N91_04215 [Pseudomonadota bacterium]|nr:hypothetical protein [Pseudomonadota bacterium]
MRSSSAAFGLAWAAVALICAVGSAAAQAAKARYPIMAPVEHYRVASPADEIALARRAAPASIADAADVLTLGSQGYETAVKGRNGFVCLVWRSWTAGFDDAEFWNPKLRAPICLNPAAARSALPAFLERTRWALAGLSKAEMVSRTQATIAANAYIAPAPGAMAYMMSKRGYLGDAVGHWHPHLRFFLSHTDGKDWGAELSGSPVCLWGRAILSPSRPSPYL